MDWFVYIVLCDDESLYTGITNNIERRLIQHSTQKGAKYFRGHNPVAIVYLEKGHDRSSATQREAQIKKLQRLKKCELIKSKCNQIKEIEASISFKRPLNFLDVI